MPRRSHGPCAAGLSSTSITPQKSRKTGATVTSSHPGNCAAGSSDLIRRHPFTAPGISERTAGRSSRNAAPESTNWSVMSCTASSFPATSTSSMSAPVASPAVSTTPTTVAGAVECSTWYFASAGISALASGRTNETSHAVHSARAPRLGRTHPRTPNQQAIGSANTTTSHVISMAAPRVVYSSKPSSRVSHRYSTAAKSVGTSATSSRLRRHTA